MRVWLKSNDYKGIKLPYNINVSNAFYGFQKLGVDIEFFENIEDILQWVSKSDIVVSFIGDAEKLFRKFNLDVSTLDYPLELRPFLKRNLGEGTIQGLLSKNELFGKFVKPTIQKAFTGRVIHDYKDLVAIGVKDCPVFYSDVIDIVSEYRCFVTYDKVVDIKPYGLGVGCQKGIDIEFLNSVLAAFNKIEDRPNGCSIDIGVSSTGENYLIEVNDGFSLGCYGLDPILYAKLLSARWSQLLGVEDSLRW